ncbi:hypothetical protein F4778DRAFT_355158 [Xylariomycetidae sp. FL2044]|nr:hypothetical protein F4778DRAFT_355158 [Xylariomycetidae sp. FL2044]
MDASGLCCITSIIKTQGIGNREPNPRTHVDVDGLFHILIRILIRLFHRHCLVNSRQLFFRMFLMCIISFLLSIYPRHAGWWSSPLSLLVVLLSPAFLAAYRPPCGNSCRGLFGSPG